MRLWNFEDKWGRALLVCLRGMVVTSVIFGLSQLQLGQTAYGLETCTEAKLRDLQVAVLNCAGTLPADCTISGAPKTERELPALKTGSKVYVLGDSITKQARTEIDSSLTEAGYKVSKINADSGRAISYDSGGGDPPGLQAVADDKDVLKSAEGIVIALGTNSGNEDLNLQIPALIKKVRDINKNRARIYWVNLFYTADGGPAKRNEVIKGLASTLDYTIIDTAQAGIGLLGDGRHPTDAGDVQFANLIASSLKSPAKAAASSLAYDPISLNFPAFPSEAQIAGAITAYLKTSYPASPWGLVDSDFGSWVMRESKLRNINPLYIMAIGKQENRFGLDGSRHVKEGFNYFGIKGKGTKDNPVEGSSYAWYSSPKEGITKMLDKLNRNINSADRGQYKDVVNFYEYIGMHQAGRIRYPGESLGPHNGGMDGFDPDMGVYVSWTTSIHPQAKRPEYNNKLYNPGIYYKNAVELVNKLTGSSLSTTPTRGATSGRTVTICQAGGSGTVGLDGYAFPLAPQRKIGYSTLPCHQYTCHWDGTPAFDLSYGARGEVVGKAVYAITAGQIVKINTQEEGWCQSIQLAGDDGYFYWYGHVIGLKVQEGDRVTAAQEMARVAEWSQSHDCAGTSDGPHLHIDRGCTTNPGTPQEKRNWGGNKECRDPAFVPFMQKLYDSLPA